LLLLLLIIIYTINLSVVRPRSCRVIYYCDTPALGIRHQLFDRVITQSIHIKNIIIFVRNIIIFIITQSIHIKKI
jgi:hypothetical protein